MDIFSELNVDDEQEEPEDKKVKQTALSVYTTRELLDEIYSRSHDERINILVNLSQEYLTELKYSKDEVKKALEKTLKQKVEGKIKAAKSFL